MDIRSKISLLFDGQHPAIVDKELFEHCWELRQLAGQAVRSRRFNRWTRVYPLSGLLRCGQCGEPMRAQAINGGAHYYRCTTRIQRKGDCPQLMVRAEEIEEQVVQVLAQIKLPPNWRERIEPFIHSAEEMGAKRQEREELRQRLNRLTELYLEGDIGRERYKQERAELIEHTMSLTFCREVCYTIGSQVARGL